MLIGQGKVHQVANYTYLELDVGEISLQEVKMNKRIAKDNRNVGLMYQLLRDASIPRECTLTIYHSIL